MSDAENKDSEKKDEKKKEGDEVVGKTTLEQDKDAAEIPIPGGTPGRLAQFLEYVNHHKGTEPPIIPKPVQSSSIKMFDINWQTFLECYNKLSVCPVQWNSSYKNIPRANKEQFLLLAEEYKDYKAISNALRIASAGDGPYFEVIVDDKGDTKKVYAVMFCEKKGNRRAICIASGQQSVGVSLTGAIVTTGVGGLLYLVNPIAAAAACVTKIAADVGISQKNVCVIAILKSLEKAGLVQLDVKSKRMKLLLENK